MTDDNVNEVLKKLSVYKRIIVSGPNRTGTTFFSKLLSQELGYRYIDENLYRYDSKVFDWYFKKNNVVIQGPGMSYRLHSICNDFDNCCVVFMRRNLEDIENSSKRVRADNRSLEIRWATFSRVVNRYKNDPVIGSQVGSYVPLIDEFQPTSSARFRYAIWDIIQRDMCNSFFEVSYEALSSHSSFLQKNDRHAFGPKQTEVTARENQINVYLKVVGFVSKVNSFVKFNFIKYILS